MQQLSFQDAAFLRMESPDRPYHVAGLMTLALPQGAPPGYLRSLATRCGRLNELWPVFNKQLHSDSANELGHWIAATHYDPAYHVFHYALPVPGRMEDLLNLVTRVHERPLDRRRPLWELHLIEGLSGNRFAIYCKVHHALVDGVSALSMVQGLFSADPQRRLSFSDANKSSETARQRMGLTQRFTRAQKALGDHYRALPQLGQLLANLGIDALQGKDDASPLPFAAPQTPFNTTVDAQRKVVLADLPLRRLRALASAHGGTVNDVLIAICGGALRTYLRELGQLPKRSLVAGVPMSIRRDNSSEGSQVAFILCPFHTEIKNPASRLRRIIKVTRKSKAGMRAVSRTAAQDFTNVLMMPTVLLTITGNASRVAPALNAIVSNVPGPSEPLYLDGARLERIYPLSVVTDGMGLNITVVSYRNKVCMGITACPTELPGIEAMGKHVRAAYLDLCQSVD